MQGKTAVEPAGTRTSGGVEIWGKAERKEGDAGRQSDDGHCLTFNPHTLPGREALCPHFTDEEAVSGRESSHSLLVAAMEPGRARDQGRVQLTPQTEPRRHSGLEHCAALGGPEKGVLEQQG